MSPSLLAQALRRALALSLAAVPTLAGQAGCGGNVVVDTASGDAGTACALLSTTPLTTLKGGCGATYQLGGAASDCEMEDGGQPSPAQCMALCPPIPSHPTAIDCTVQPQGGSATLTCLYSVCGTGRRPPGLQRARAAGTSPIARFLGEVAHLEAASVVAFARLAAELQGHGAPARLVRAARRAARDEARHARVTQRFALRAGARPRPVAVTATPARPLEAIAVDNAVEGCVRETFGAVLALRQAGEARDGAHRRAMAPIAREETRHAALSWELARWLDAQLDAPARRRVRRARDHAVAALRREAAQEPHPTLVAALGVPTAAQARAAIDALSVSLWSAR